MTTIWGPATSSPSNNMRPSSRQLISQTSPAGMADLCQARTYQTLAVPRKPIPNTETGKTRKKTPMKAAESSASKNGAADNAATTTVTKGSPGAVRHADTASRRSPKKEGNVGVGLTAVAVTTGASLKRPASPAGSEHGA